MHKHFLKTAFCLLLALTVCALPGTAFAAEKQAKSVETPAAIVIISDPKTGEIYGETWLYPEEGQEISMDEGIRIAYAATFGVPKSSELYRAQACCANMSLTTTETTYHNPVSIPGNCTVTVSSVKHCRSCWAVHSSTVLRTYTHYHTA